MSTNAIRLFYQSGLAMVMICAVSLTLSSIAFAEIGDSKSQIEQQYGEPAFVQDGRYRIWIQEEWKPVASDGVKAYGYMTTEGKMNVTIWIEYNKQNKVVKETVVMDGNSKIRDFKDYFKEIYSAIIAPDSIVLINKSISKGQLEVIVRGKDNNYSLIYFLLDNTDDTTAINMHSKIRGFEITAISADDVKNYLKGSTPKQPVTNASGGRPIGIEKNWLKADNFFQKGLFFSEKLVPRPQTDMIIIHHTAIEDMSVADIHELHLTNGWAGIGYQKVILPDGTVEDGRPESMIGAHALGVNPRSIGIVVVGNFELTSPSAVQMDALVKLTLGLMAKYHIPLENVVPHRGVTAGTSCPGALFPWEEFIQTIKKNANDKML